MPTSTILTPRVTMSQPVSECNMSADNDRPRKEVLLAENVNTLTVCGATRTSNGSRLLVCSRCESVAYCCADEHQKIHWKSGGHKQECTLE